MGGDDALCAWKPLRGDPSYLFISAHVGLVQLTRDLHGQKYG